MDVEAIRATKEQLINGVKLLRTNRLVLKPDGVKKIKDSLVSIAGDTDKWYPYISARLKKLSNELFLPMNPGYTFEGVTFGQVVELLDFLIHEAESPRQDIWDMIHPHIKKSSKQLYLDGHYTNAATDAFVEINTRVKKLFKIISPNVPVPDGTAAMTTVFSPKKPLLKVGDLSDKTCEDKQTGLMNMLLGAISALRNPKCHNNEEMITQEEAMRRLMFASTLMYQIDEAVKYSAISE